jgi:hypothetical protein
MRHPWFSRWRTSARRFKWSNPDQDFTLQDRVIKLGQAQFTSAFKDKRNRFLEALLGFAHRAALAECARDFIYPPDVPLVALLYLSFKLFIQKSTSLMMKIIA